MLRFRSVTCGFQKSDPRLNVMAVVVKSSSTDQILIDHTRLVDIDAAADFQIKFALCDRGHSTASVGLHLGISPTTVKTHRKHLYEKLGIGSQYELFAHFLRSLDTPPG